MNEHLALRVMVTDVWETVSFSADPAMTVAELKHEVLSRALKFEPRDDDYEVKHLGALVLDERKTLRDLEIESGAPLIVLPARRRPVR